MVPDRQEGAPAGMSAPDARAFLASLGAGVNIASWNIRYGNVHANATAIADANITPGLEQTTPTDSPPRLIPT